MQLSYIYNLDIMNYNILLDIFIILSIIMALKVITDYNPMFSILYLILLFINISIYLYYIGMAIMSLIYLLIYIGAISILFIFILSLLDIKVTELYIISNNNDIPIILISSSLLYYSIYNIYNNIYINNLKSIEYYNILIDNWYSIYNTTILANIGNILYTEYSIILIIIAIILLLCIIGTIILSINNEKN